MDGGWWGKTEVYNRQHRSDWTSSQYELLQTSCTSRCEQSPSSLGLPRQVNPETNSCHLHWIQNECIFADDAGDYGGGLRAAHRMQGQGTPGPCQQDIRGVGKQGCLGRMGLHLQHHRGESQKQDLAVQQANVTKILWAETIKFPWQTFQDADVKRSFKFYSLLGMAALPEEKYKKYTKIVADMEAIYSKAKVCDYKNKENCDLSLEPELTELLQTSRDPEELKHIWTEFRSSTGKQCKDLYKEYVVLANEAARLNNVSDCAEYWKIDFDTPTFEADIEALWKQVEPLYKELHAYVRMKLNAKYGDDVVKSDGPIPAHLLGNMWAQAWSNIYDLLVPYPEKESLDVTEEMVKQKYTPLKMFKLAESFFTSINLSAMPDSFWEKSIIEKPEGVELVCHASAWDFYDSKDFRIKMCTRITMEDLFTVHHEMGHVQYFIQYKNQPHVYKEGANSGFHEAIGDVISLSVQTTKHLKEIGLLESDVVDKEQVINYLLFTALDKLAFLPFGFLVDQYRWKIFKGDISPENYNCEWWKLREKYQGLEPPADRNEEDFDAGAKYHVVASVPYIRYFVSFVIQFQFHRALCEKANQFDSSNPSLHPLHQCDIYKSHEAGNLLGKMLQMGSSKPWPEAMEVVTGQRKMDASALMQYFKPLYDWLKEENKRNGVFVGWKPTTKKCTKKPE
ncbi:angiotensin-converting enzyme-like [Rhodnius prolixus]|uniref:angiotensin-converting enzyme-like n=1 Tax=Rhodnius prolixus TaxID=13249 RepID=UPI003D18B3C0